MLFVNFCVQRAHTVVRTGVIVSRGKQIKCIFFCDKTYCMPNPGKNVSKHTLKTTLKGMVGYETEHSIVKNWTENSLRLSLSKSAGQNFWWFV